MSRTYRVRIPSDLSERVTARDAIEYRLAASTLVAEEEAAGILRGVLLSLGGSARQDGSVELDVAGAKVLVEPSTSRALASLELEAGVPGAGSDPLRPARRGGRPEPRTDAQAVLEARAGEALDRALPEVQAVLREAMARTEVEAIRRRAARMGRILSVLESEDGATGARRVVIDLDLEGP